MSRGLRAPFGAKPWDLRRTSSRHPSICGRQPAPPFRRESNDAARADQSPGAPVRAGAWDGRVRLWSDPQKPRDDARSRLRLVAQEISKEWRPSRGLLRGIVSARTCGGWQYCETSGGKLRHGILQCAKLRWIELVVCEIDRKDSRLDPLQLRGWVILHRGFQLVEAVVCVAFARI